MKWLSEITKDDVGEVGGKAANLGELLSIDMPVPDGFVVTDPELATSLLVNCFKLDSEFVAVRSSGIAEDGETASMAGQHDTFLYVGERHIARAVADCFKSAYSARATAYREENGITETGIAVLVQTMIDPAYSGVLFTADPVDGDRSKMVVEWVEGTGDKLVSGEVTPESQEIPHSLYRHEYPRVFGFNIELLNAYALQIESHFGCPQDIEWCVDKNNKLWILQARPITTL